MLRRGKYLIFVVIASMAGFFLWPPPDHDARYDYVAPGEALLRGIESDNASVSFHLPLASILAHFIYNRIEPFPLKRKVYLAFLGVASAALVFAISCLFSPVECALLSTSIWFFLWCSIGNDYPQSFFILFSLVSAGVLVWRASVHTLFATFVLAMSVGASLFFRSTLAFFPPFLAFCEWIFIFHKEKKSYWKHFAILCIVPYLFLIPWMSMNWIVHQQWIPFEHGEASSNVVTGALGLVQTIDADWGSLIDDPIESSRSGDVLMWAVEEVLRHPFRYMAAYGARLKFIVLLHPVLLLLALVAFIRHRDKKGVFELGLFTLYYAGVHCFMTVQYDYFYPLWASLAVLAGLILGGKGPREPAFPRFSKFFLFTCLGALLSLCLYAAVIVVVYADLALRRLPSSDEALEQAIALNKNDAWLFAERGLRKLSIGMLDSAIEDLSLAHILRPDSPDLELRLAWAKLLKGDFSSLLRWRPPENFYGPQMKLRGHVLKTYAYLKAGRRSEAQRELRAALEIWKSEMIVVKGSGTDREKRVLNRLRLSFKSFLACLMTPPFSQLPMEERLPVINELIELVPEAEIFRIEKAVLVARIAQRHKPISAAPLKRTKPLKSLQAKGNASGVVKPDRVDIIKPSFEDRQKIYLQFQEKRDYSRALEILNELIRENPSSASLFNDRGLCHYLAGSEEDSINDLRQAIQLDPGFLSAAMTLGAVYISKGQYSTALRVFDEALLAQSNSNWRSVRAAIVKSRSDILEKAARESATMP